MTKSIKEFRIAAVIEALDNQAASLEYKASRTDSASAETFRRRAKGYRDVATHYERKHALLVLKRTQPTEGEK